MTRDKIAKTNVDSSHTSTKPCPRRGFTLIESVVVVMVIGLLLALVIPAVMSAREASRKLACSNNLKQISLALNNYTTVLNTYPPGGNGNKGFSFLSMILPLLENAPAYNAINFDFTAFVSLHSVNSTVIFLPIQTFICPTDRHSDTGTSAVTNYAGNGGTGFQRSGYDGIFAPGNYLTIGPQHVTDGLSNTVAVSEWRVGTPPPLNQPIFYTPLLDKPSQFSRFVDICGTAIVDHNTIMNSNKGHFWIHGDFIASLYNHVLPLNGVSCLNGGFSNTGSWTAGSMHSGGAYSLFCDGHVQFIHSTVNSSTWHAISTRARNELIDGL